MPRQRIFTENLAVVTSVIKVHELLEMVLITKYVRINLLYFPKNNIKNKTLSGELSSC